jgi:hypothetical protein
MSFKPNYAPIYRLLNQHIRNVMKIAGERRKLFIMQTHDSLEIDESLKGCIWLVNSKAV